MTVFVWRVVLATCFTSNTEPFIETKLCVALLKNIMSKNSCQYVMGRSFSDWSRVL